ncbi:MAG TPA: hypothetical protein VMA13_10580 [Candidatus Saccharimonadales bacterium]|nr:hypothetical protein [Candidatus Saccharimonadales bacterium]
MKMKFDMANLQTQLESLQKTVAQLAAKSAGGLALNIQPQEAK